VLVQPFAQHQEEVQPLAVIPHALAVLARHGANSVELLEEIADRIGDYILEGLL